MSAMSRLHIPDILQPACPLADAHKMIAKYIAAGGNFIDTADVYVSFCERENI